MTTTTYTTVDLAERAMVAARRLGFYRDDRGRLREHTRSSVLRRAMEIGMKIIEDEINREIDRGSQTLGLVATRPEPPRDPMRKDGDLGLGWHLDLKNVQSGADST